MKRIFVFVSAILLAMSVSSVFGQGWNPTGNLQDPYWADALEKLTSEEQARIISLVRLNTVIFNEIFNAANDAHDWIELRNITDTDVDLSDWRLIGVTPDASISIGFPAGTVLPAGKLLLLVNTDPNEPNTPLAVSEDASYHHLVDGTFTLPAGDFMLLLRSPTEWEDNAGSYLFGHQKSPTTVDFTLDTAYSRAKASVLGHQADAWAVSGYQGGLGYDSEVPEAMRLGTPGHRREMIGDVNGDGIVNILDLVRVASQIGQSGETSADLNSDGVINIQDLVLVANAMKGAAAAPSARGLSAKQVEGWLQLAKSEATLPTQTLVSQPDFSYQRGIQVLEQLHRMLVPKETALLANYPNPFNPETWIPYQLATDSDVLITIYDGSGTLVRQLNLGHQPVGIYQSRSRAAYWDGTNELGEAVASGIYFYTLTTDDFSATRKMLILK